MSLLGCFATCASSFACAVKPGSSELSPPSTLQEIKLNLLLGAILASRREFGSSGLPQSPYILRFRGSNRLERSRFLSLASARVRLALRGSSPRLPTQ